MTASIDLQQLIADCADASPKEILKQAFAAFGDELWLSFSGAEDVVLLDMAWKNSKGLETVYDALRRYSPGAGTVTAVDGPWLWSIAAPPPAPRSPRIAATI